MENGHDTQEFRIEKGIPLPTGKRSGFAKYPFPQMEVGDSFVSAIPDDDPNANSLRRAAAVYGRRHAIKFTCAARLENGQRVLRIWRVA